MTALMHRLAHAVGLATLAVGPVVFTRDAYGRLWGHIPCPACGRPTQRVPLYDAEDTPRPCSRAEAFIPREPPELTDEESAWAERTLKNLDVEPLRADQVRREVSRAPSTATE